MKKSIAKFNSADFVILMAVIAAVCGLFFRQPIERMVRGLFFQSETVYTVSISDVDEAPLKDTVLYDGDGNNLGTVYHVEISDDMKSCIAAITAESLSDELGTYIGNYTFIAPGKPLELYAKNGKMYNCVVKKVETER